MPSAPIFISYSRRNRDAVRRIYSRMEAAGYPLWRDLSDLEPGDKWWPQIQEAIDACDSMVLCMSVESLLSTVVGDEWNYARQHGKRVVPAVVDEVFKHERVASGEVKIPRWMSDADWLDLREDAPESDLHWQRLFKTLDTPYEPRRRPMMIPRLPDQYIDRPQEKEPVIEALLDADNRAVALTTALKGAGGYGKTTLACAIARDVRVSGAYDDGLLFVTLGESLTESALIAKVLDLIETITQQRPALADANAARVALNDAIGDRNILLVVDDVWDAAHLAPFLVEGPRCAKLITTRNERLLPAGAQRHLIDQMRPQEALALLTWGLPEAPRTLNPRLTALADRLGRWAQVLKMVNGVLRQQTAQGQTLAGALDYVGEGLTEEGLEAFDDPSSTNQRHRTARAALAVSLRQLKDDADRAAFAQLAIFPEDADVPLAVLEKLWGRSGFKTRALCDTFFAGLALLQEYNAGAGTLRLHDVIRTDLRVQHHESLVDWNTALLAALGDPYALPHPYAWRFYAYHLLEAGQADRLRALLLDYRWLRTKLEVLDAAALVADCKQFTNDNSIHLLESALILSEHTLEKHKDQLALQLVGRLWSWCDRNNEIFTLIRQIEATCPRPTLLPCNAAFQQAGSALIRSLQGNSSAAYSPDGHRIVGANREVIKIWDALTGAELLKLTGHLGIVTSVAYSPDGRRIVSASDDKTVKLWDALMGTELLTLIGHTDRVESVAYSPDGRRIVSASDDKTVKLWDALMGTELLTLTRHTDSIESVAYSPDGQRIVGAGRDGSKIWDAETGDELLTLHEGTAAAYSPDGQRIVKSAHDWIIIVDAYTGNQLFFNSQDAHRWYVSAVCYSPDGRQIVSASADKTLMIWDAETGKALLTLTGHTDRVESVAYSPDGRRIVSAGRDGIKIWDAQLFWETRGGMFHNEPRSIAYSPDGNRIVSAGEDEIRIWDVITGAELLRLPGDSAAAFSPNGQQILGMQDLMKILHATESERLSSLGMGRFIIKGSFSHSQRLKIWDATSGIELLSCQGQHEWYVSEVAYSPDGLQVVSASADKTLKIWDASTGSELLTLMGHTDRVESVAYSPDGQRIVSAGRDEIKIWDVITGAGLLTLPGHQHALFSPSGHEIVGLGSNGINVWDATTGNELTSYLTEQTVNSRVGYSPDGRYIVSTSGNQIRVWDVNQSNHLATFHADAELISFVWSPTENKFAAIDEVGRILIINWLLPGN